jgi:ribokinase
MPAPGETVCGENFATCPGGKGANQAVALARLGGKVALVGRVGDDTFGRELRDGLAAEGVDVEHVMTAQSVATGTAMIIVNGQGENTIVVAGGANALVTPDDVFAKAELFEKADTVLLQLELPCPTVRAAIDLARRHGCRTILDPAPAPKNFPPELCRVDIISPNAIEAERLTGKRAVEERVDKLIAAEFIDQGARAAVLKLGPRGCLVVMADGHFYRVPACKVEVVDTTAAGDAFTAALALALSRGENMHQAAKFACAAGALACTRMGAQSAMPTALEVQMLMRDQGM